MKTLLVCFSFRLRYWGMVIFIALSVVNAQAQLCTGSLGTPIVDIDFGAGSSTHGAALGSSITSYTYSGASFPTDGSYTVENTTAGAGNVWWSTTDHTGTSGGYMMVVNASISTTDYFYKNTIPGLCPGTTYEFAGWVMNLLRSSDKSPPNITFSIETTSGTVLNTYTTGPVPLAGSPLWRHYGFFFTTPAGVSTVVIRMRNNSAGGAPANDLALDDITFTACGPQVTASVDGSVNMLTFCAGTNTTAMLQGALSSGYTTPAYQWQMYNGSSWQDVAGAVEANYAVSLDGLAAGTYKYRLMVGESASFSSPQCRVISNEVTLVIDPRPIAAYSLGADVVCLQQPVTFVDQSISTVPLTYQWSFGDGGSSNDRNPSHAYAATGGYVSGLIVSTAQGCKDTAALLAPLQVVAVPLAGFSVTPMDTSVFYPDVTFTDESSDVIDCSINWGDGVTTGCGDNTHAYQLAGTYTITQRVMNEAGCYTESTAQVIIRPEFRFQPLGPMPMWV